MSKKKDIVVFSVEDCEVMEEAIDFFNSEIFEFDAFCPAMLRSSVGSARSKLVNLTPTDGADDELPLTPKELASVTYAIRYIANNISSGELTEDELPQNLCSYDRLMGLFRALTPFLEPKLFALVTDF